MMSLADYERVHADLRRLIEAWNARYRQRAVGGMRAIQGFRYQFLVMLVKAVRVWKRNPSSDPSVVTEVLSDILNTSRPRIVEAVQVKRTLTSHSLSDALDEFLLIYRLAQECGPELAEHLRFQIMTMRSDLRDAAASVKRWLATVLPQTELDIPKLRVGE